MNQAVIALPGPPRADASRGRPRPAALSWQRPSPKAVADFSRGLAVMATARLPITDALRTLETQTHGRLHEATRGVREGVEGGAGLAASFARYPDVFDPLYVQLVRVGEAAGVLPDVLDRLAGYLERSAALRRRVRLALVYPAVVVAVAGGAVAFLLAFVVPTFAAMYADFGAELPAPTRFVLAASGAAVTAGPWLLLGAVAAAIVGRRWVATDGGERAAEGVLLRVPVLGPLLAGALVARFCRTVGTLVRGGVPLVEALDISRSSGASPRSRDAAATLAEALRRGGRLRDSLGREALFPPLVVQLLAAGEESARLDEVLLLLAQKYEEDTDGAVDALAAIIEPVLIVLLGLVVGGILVALYLPMFDLAGTIR